MEHKNVTSDTASKDAQKTVGKKSTMPSSNLMKLFEDELKDIYWAEKHLVKALPKMKKAATSPELQDAFESHLEQTKTHVERLEEVFDLLGKKAQAKKCDAMDGLVKEGESIIEDTDDDTATRDVGLIIAAQKVEHYEIATYGGLVQLAITIGQHEAAELLDKSLMEEEDTDSLLTDIAESCINIEAEEEEKFSAKKKNEKQVS
jgi:ferritin-like metal-binding protein YciE